MSEHTYSPKVDVIIPTYKSGRKLSRLLKMLGLRTYPMRRIIVMNMEKAYWNDKGYQRIPNMKIHHLSKTEFDHGITRNRGAHYSRTGIIVFMTDDAMPADEHLIGYLMGMFRQRGPQGELMTMAYTRQPPDKDCPIAERYTRSFNYPEEDCIKTKESLERVGIKTFFASNICCIYDREKFWLQGGFITKIIFNEDMIFTDRAAPQDNYVAAYVTEARVIRSYNYGCTAQFRRDFDLTASQTDHPEVFTGIRSESERICLVKQTAGRSVKVRCPWLILSMIVESGFKYMGHRVGRCYRMLPKSLAVKCNINKEYWK